MAIETPEQQLERVQAAIRAIESGAQEYTIGGRTVRKGDLKMLYDRERELLRQIDIDTNGTRAYARWGR